jgi:hypothetical protein
VIFIRLALLTAFVGVTDVALKLINFAFPPDVHYYDDTDLV